jgi:UDP-3-O-acyl-N-acetylglucosamine deacetylase
MENNSPRNFIIISSKITFQPKHIKKDKERHFIHINRKIYQEEINIPNARTPTFIKET